jgi:hypothetical protein
VEREAAAVPVTAAVLNPRLQAIAMDHSQKSRNERTTGDQPAVPFLLPADKRSHINGPRILEALIIAAAAAVGGSLLTTAKLEERLAGMERQQQRTEQQIEQLRQAIYRPRWEGQAMTVPHVRGEGDSR